MMQQHHTATPSHTHNQLQETKWQKKLLSDVLKGLSATPKRLPSKYFYDDEGIRLFQKIMALPEYYLTCAEMEILNHYRDEMVQCVADQPFTLIELGAGDGTKTSILIESILKVQPHCLYVPIDISTHAIELLTQSLTKQFPTLHVQGIADEYARALGHLSKLTTQRKVVLFLGSNIGNFTKQQAYTFLKSVRRRLQPGDWLLIGFDLKKDIPTLIRAYSDAAGVTREFNFNLLRRLNRELQANFDLSTFEHYATYNPILGAMESYLISKKAQTVCIKAAGRTITLDAFEPIHTEYSFKYSEREIKNFAAATGFESVKNFYDQKHQFVDALWRAV
jgi:L-histidine N-alpha-methyltransferase